ncbi:hypothetical protein F4678DRAFT_452230 [Xylaria arbuscula]|nr:hypothetical protein F4678DRAFT_452230 [Xylaria arbuscula]
MSALGRWLLSKSPISRSSSSSSTPSNSGQGLNRVLHGRVTKPGHTERTSDTTKYKLFGQYSECSEEDDDEDVTLQLTSDVAASTKNTDESDSERQHSRKKIKLEETEESSDDQGEDDGKGNSGFSLAMMARQAGSQEHYSSSSSSDADPLSKPGPDEKPDPDTESDPETKSRPDTEPDLDTAWRLEQIYLNTILNARNEFTLMPSTWRMHFRGIPLPDSLFYIKTKQKSIRPRIYARSDRLDYRGALALRKLIDIHARIQDIRGDEAEIQQDKELDAAEKEEAIRNISADMAGRLRRSLEQALDWANQDGEIERYGDQIPPNVRIMELRGITQTDEPESEVKIQNELCELAEEWRTHASNGDAPAPVLFGFIIMKHIITIVTLDAADPGAIMHVPCQLHMAERNQHQWNALAIMVTVCWARDVLLDYIDARPDLKAEVKEESSDPDA